MGEVGEAKSVNVQRLCVIHNISDNGAMMVELELWGRIGATWYGLADYGNMCNHENNVKLVSIVGNHRRHIVCANPALVLADLTHIITTSLHGITPQSNDHPSAVTTILSNIFWNAFAPPFPSSISSASFLARSISTAITFREYSKLPVLSMYATA